MKNRYDKMINAAACLLLGLCLFSLSADAYETPKLWPSTDLTKVLVSDLPPDDAPQELVMEGARGEVISGQVVYTPGKPVDAATVEIGPMRHSSSGAVLPSGAVSIQWVRYIDIQKNSSRIPQDDLDIIAPDRMPDTFWEGDTIPVEHGIKAILDNSIYIEHFSQPVWLEITVPEDAEPGDYESTLTVSGDGISTSLPVRLHVWGFEVPAERHLSVVVWWSLPGVGFDAELYSDEYWDLLRHFCRFVVAHRQTDAGIIPIDIIGERESGRSYTYDFTNLEHYAEIAFSEGIRCLHLHSAGQLSPEGEMSGVGRSVLDRSRRVLPREDALRRLAALEKFMAGKGWTGRFAVNISDEPFMHHEESYAEVVRLVHEAAPHIRIIEALEAEYLGDLDVYCPKINHLDMWYPVYDRHRQNGSELWFYTSRIPVGIYPNRFVDNSLLKMRVQFWMQYLYDLDGYLHWALNHFYTDEPYTEQAIARNSPPGNPNIAYPGKSGLIGSLRLSAQRDGLEEYEYLWVLEDRIRRLKETIGGDAFWVDPRQRPLELCRRVTWSLHDYTRDPELMLETRRQVADEIDAFDDDLLLYVQTSPPEGTEFPAGPRNCGVRGLVTSGARVMVNGELVENVRESGYFSLYYFVPDGKSDITVTAELDGKMKTVTRTFELTP